MRLRQFFGRWDAIASFAHWTCSARTSSAGRDATTAAMDDASASAATNARQRSAVLRASRGAKRLHAFLLRSCAHAAISSQRTIILSTPEVILTTDSCIVNFNFLSANVTLYRKVYQPNLTTALQTPCKVARFAEANKRATRDVSLVKYAHAKESSHRRSGRGGVPVTGGAIPRSAA